jgi:hypothetical protein
MITQYRAKLGLLVQLVFKKLNPTRLNREFITPVGGPGLYIHAHSEAVITNDKEKGKRYTVLKTPSTFTLLSNRIASKRPKRRLDGTNNKINNRLFFRETQNSDWLKM